MKILFCSSCKANGKGSDLLKVHKAEWKFCPFCGGTLTEHEYTLPQTKTTSELAVEAGAK